jgi:hypothetical protein
LCEGACECENEAVSAGDSEGEGVEICVFSCVTVFVFDRNPSGLRESVCVIEVASECVCVCVCDTDGVCNWRSEDGTVFDFDFVLKDGCEGDGEYDPNTPSPHPSITISAGRFSPKE